MESLFAAFQAFVYELINFVDTLLLSIIDKTKVPITETGEVNTFVAFFEGLIHFIPTLIILYAIVKLLSSGMQVFAKCLSVLILIGLAYMIMNNYLDIPAIVNSGFNWN